MDTALILNQPAFLDRGTLGPGERRGGIMLVTMVLGYAAVIVPLSGVSAATLASIGLALAPLVINCAVLIACVAIIMAMVVPHRRERLASQLLWLMVATVMILILQPSFALFKQLVLPRQSFLIDPILTAIGRAIMGQSGWVLTHRLFGDGPAWRLFDGAYSLWLPLAFLFPLLVSQAFSTAIRFRLLLGWALSWILVGSVAAWFLASVGPCYYTRLVGPDASYTALLHALGRIAQRASLDGHVFLAVEYQPILLRSFVNHTLSPVGGISAMPSMHVALATLFAIAACQIGRGWGLLFAGYAALVWISSIYLGWHHMLDGPVATVMVVLIWKMTAPVATRLGLVASDNA